MKNDHTRKILVFISNLGDIQRFSARGAFCDLAKNHTLQFVLPLVDGVPQINGERALGINSKFDYIEVNANNRTAQWQELITLCFLRHQRKFASYQARVRGVIRPQFGKSIPLRDVLDDGFIGLVRYTWRWLKFLKPSLKFMRLQYLALPFKHDSYTKQKLSELGKDQAMESYISNFQPDIVLVPTSFHDLFVHEVLSVMKDRPEPTLLLQSNWDNPSSKGILFYHPTHIALWSEQSKKLSTETQNFNLKTISIIGGAQLEDFRYEAELTKEQMCRSFGIPDNERLILFAGSAREFDELKILHKLEKKIDQGELPASRIIYRPHPWSRKARYGEFMNIPWKYSIMDPESQKTGQGKNFEESTDNLFYSFKHLNNLYSNVDCLVVPMSTAIVEAMIKGLPVVALAYSDGTSNYDPNLISKMSHCVDLWNIEGIIKCDDPTSMINDVKLAFSHSDDVRIKDALKIGSKYFAHMGEATYSENLNALINEILKIESLENSCHD